MATLKLRDINKLYGKTHVMHDVSLDVETGEFVVFVGPSGCGKSTLLRMIAGLESISSGTLEIDGQLMNDIPSSKRGIAMVFQSYALYPHMTVFENMAFSLRIAKTPNDEVTRRVEQAAKILQLDEYLQRLPKALSGGQRQRVAIGRAIVREPKVFLFDEPLSNLDAALRARTRIEIAKLKEDMPGSTMIYVTHDQVEAMTLADKIVVLRDGRVEQVGSPLELYNTPQNEFVAGFIGSPQMNFVQATAKANKLTATGKAPLSAKVADGPVSVGIRPEHFVTTTAAKAFVSGTLDLIEHLGEYALLYISTEDGTEIIAKIEEVDALQRGQQVHLSVADKHIHLFDPETKTRL